ncbi:MAG: hypothetical protein PUA51_08080 [Oscillospiraceae bacterium]|nr:hypothetical protein [Oscillospiraceae bacterium]
MIDVTKPRDYWKIIERGNEGCWFRIVKNHFGLPFELFSWSDGVNLKNRDCYCMDGTHCHYGEENLYTDYPAVAVRIEDYLYYISVSENPEVLAEYPSEYEEQVEKVLDFVRENHEIFSLHWYGELNDSDLCNAIAMKKGRVCRGKRDYEYQHYLKQCESITPKLKQLKNAGKYHGDI